MQQENPAWIALLISGIVNLLWALVYLAWTALGLLWGGFTAIMVAVASLDSGDASSAIVSLIYVLLPIVQGCVYLLAIPMALVTMVAAFRLKAWRSKGLVWLGAILAVGNPVLGLISSVTSCCNSCSGFFLGNIGTLIVTVIGGVAAVWTAVVLFSEEGQAAFQANA